MLSLREHAELLTPRPANSSQQPTACRSLARRFRASFCATLRVAPPESEGTWRLSERTLGAPNLGTCYSDRHSPAERPRVMTWSSFVKRLLGGRSPEREGTPVRREIPLLRSDVASNNAIAWLEDDDDLAWLNPPITMHDPSAWDRYWNDQISHGLNPQ